MKIDTRLPAADTGGWSETYAAIMRELDFDARQEEMSAAGRDDVAPHRASPPSRGSRR
jgi:hypothetical protein